MTISQRFAAFFFALFMLTLTGCAVTGQQPSIGQIIDDSVVTAKVKAAIFDDPNLESLQISVETFKGIVQLSGFVDSSDALRRAAEITRGVEGVKDVRNNLILK